MASPSKTAKSGKSSRHARELLAAFRVSQALSRHIHIDALVEQALHTALDVVGADAASVLLADSERQELVFRHVIGAKADRLKGTSIPWNQGIASAVFMSGQPQITFDAARDRRHLAKVDARTGYKTRDMVTVPLKQLEGRPIGVLQVLNKRKGRLGKEDVSILTIIATLMAAAIEQARLYEETKLAQVSRLLGDVGHDVGNLMTPVMCGVDLLNQNLNEFFDRMPDPIAGEGRETKALCDQVFGMLRDNTRRIQDLVKEMAACVKGLSAPPTFATFHFAQVAHHVIETLRMLAVERGVTLTSEGLDDLPSLFGDERRLYVAVYNLVNNAIPEVPSGGSVTIRGRRGAKTGEIVVEVSDTGRGMPPDVCRSLFTDRAISRKSGGTGLGTKIVKDVVDAHGGRIHVDSKEGVGTTFRIHLPIKPPADILERVQRSTESTGSAPAVRTVSR
jgi:signal transduction histidine kinase